MVLSYLRLRRALSLSAALLKPIPSIASAPSPPSLSSTSTATSINPQNPSIDLIEHFPFQSRSFRSSSIVLSSRARQSYNRDNEDDKISPDAILFEGCDYNHWLITMDFPKDPKPTPEEMVETYVQTCAKVVGSVEEAKKRIYACSTTTYQGFQVDVSEEMSEKFQGLPGVVFVLPDSYIDPVHKEYGGDKYINGTIIPRPPPVQYGRTGGRYSDQNREFNRPNRPRGPYQQGNTSYDNQGSMQGDARNFGAQQNYGPPRIVERRDPMPMNNTNASGGRVDYQSNYNQGDRGNYPPQGRRDFQPGDQRNYAPPEQRNYAPPQTGSYGQGAGANFGQGAPLEQRNYAPPQSGSYGQGAGGSFGHGAGGSYGQGKGGSYGQGAGGSYRQGVGSNYRQGAGGNYGQGAGGSQGQGVGGGFGPEPGGNYGQGAGGPHGQATGSAYGQGDFRQGENQRFSNVQRTGEQQPAK